MNYAMFDPEKGALKNNEVGKGASAFAEGLMRLLDKKKKAKILKNVDKTNMTLNWQSNKDDPFRIG